MPEQERIAYERYRDDLHHQASMVESTYKIGILKGEKSGIKKGEKIGIEKGEKIGIEKGEKIGIKKGEKKGEQKKAEAIAIRLMASGDMDAQKISDLTGLTMEEIEGLKGLEGSGTE